MVSHIIKGLSAFEHALGTEIFVPENNILMGAIGAALLVREEAKRTMATGTNWKSNFRGFELLSIDFKTNAFNCQGCPNRCEIVSITMRTGRSR